MFRKLCTDIYAYKFTSRNKNEKVYLSYYLKTDV